MEPIIEHNAPRGTQQAKDEPSGGALKALQIVIEIRRARQTIESQLKDIKSAAKSKIAALKKAEARAAKKAEARERKPGKMGEVTDGRAISVKEEKEKMPREKLQRNTGMEGESKGQMARKLRNYDSEKWWIRKWR